MLRQVMNIAPFVTELYVHFFFFIQKERKKDPLWGGLLVNLEDCSDMCHINVDVHRGVKLDAFSSSEALVSGRAMHSIALRCCFVRLDSLNGIWQFRMPLPVSSSLFAFIMVALLEQGAAN
jgi:hypothetical protein